MVGRTAASKKPPKVTQVKLIESEELARALTASAGTGIYIVQEGRFQYANSLFQELTGYTEKELLRTYSMNLVHPEDRDVVRKKAIENLKGRSSYPYEHRFVKKKGEMIWVLERVTFAEYRARPAAVASITDIADREHAEEKLEHLNNVLCAIGNVNLLISRERDRYSLLKDICDNLVSLSFTEEVCSL